LDLDSPQRKNVVDFVEQIVITLELNI